jgi:hypothetical protein
VYDEFKNTILYKCKLMPQILPWSRWKLEIELQVMKMAAKKHSKVDCIRPPALIYTAPRWYFMSQQILQSKGSISLLDIANSQNSISIIRQITDNEECGLCAGTSWVIGCHSIHSALQLEIQQSVKA